MSENWYTYKSYILVAIVPRFVPKDFVRHCLIVAELRAEICARRNWHISPRRSDDVRGKPYCRSHERILETITNNMCSVPTSPTFRQNGWDERGIDMGEIVKYHRPTCIVQFVQLGFNVFLTGRTF